MNIEIKKAIKAGNSSAVILPRSWLDREVRVELIEKTPEIILKDVLNIAKKHMDIGNIIGIYLTGSHARSEEERESDIDILIISDKVDKEEIKEGIYSILVVSLDLLKWKLKNDLFPLGQMIKEALPLINGDYLKHMREVAVVTRQNVQWYLDTTKEKIEMVSKILKSNHRGIDSRVVYTLILRIKTIYIIEKMLKNQKYSNKEFIRLIKRISGSENPYNDYLAVKNNLRKKSLAGKEHAERLRDYLEKQLEKINESF